MAELGRFELLGARLGLYDLHGKAGAKLLISVLPLLVASLSLPHKEIAQVSGQRHLRRVVLVLGPRASGLADSSVQKSTGAHEHITCLQVCLHGHCSAFHVARSHEGQRFLLWYGVLPNINTASQRAVLFVTHREGYAVQAC